MGCGWFWDITSDEWEDFWEETSKKLVDTEITSHLCPKRDGADRTHLWVNVGFGSREILACKYCGKDKPDDKESTDGSVQ